MGQVDDGGRPLEDILSRLDDLSRSAQPIDLRDAPTTASPAAPGEAVAESAASSATPERRPSPPAESMERIMPDEMAVPPSIVPPPIPAVASSDGEPAEPVIDLRAPATASPLEPPAAAPARLVEPGDRAAARVVTPETDTGSRYGRHGAVAPVVSRPDRTPHNVPVLPVSVKDDGPDDVVASRPRSSRWTILLAIVGVLLLALVAVLTVL